MKKGFTLIELLAVILILGIIALIAIPTVNNILKESRRGAFQSTLTNLEKAIEEKCTTEQIKNQEITTMYIIEGGVISPKLDIKGSLPDGTIYVNKNCEVSYTLSDNNFTGTKEVGGEVVIGEKGSTTTIYKEAILNGTDPVLSTNLIPVIINDDGTVRKADLNSKWYSYAEKKWANAVILTDSGKVEDDGIIKEESIESYFVWIPRYKYKLFDMGNYDTKITGYATENKAKPIEIIFENKDTEVSVGTNVGDYHSHPAFQAFNTNGLWVGKFETSGTMTDLKIKPNQNSITRQTVKAMFDASLGYSNTNKSHLMKNTEWGAVAYLSHSIYGIKEEININNHSGMMTGYSAVDKSKYGDNDEITLPYNTTTGYKASTTENISGVYDMSGGVNEYMAAYIDGNYGASGFSSNPKDIYGQEYFDVYNAAISLTTDYKYRILGDATGEMGPFYQLSSSWYADNSSFIQENLPWIHRGGYYSIGFYCGSFSFDNNSGVAMEFTGFRIILAE